jgi:hypothetical protein
MTRGSAPFHVQCELAIINTSIIIMVISHRTHDITHQASCPKNVWYTVTPFHTKHVTAQVKGAHSVIWAYFSKTQIIL